MGAMVSHVTGVSIVCSTVCSDADQRKLQSSASLALVRGIHRWPMNSSHKGHERKKCSIWWRHHAKKTSKLRFTGLCEGTSEFPAQRASENISIWWRHHVEPNHRTYPDLSGLVPTVLGKIRAGPYGFGTHTCDTMRFFASYGSHGSFSACIIILPAQIWFWYYRAPEKSPCGPVRCPQGYCTIPVICAVLSLDKK